MSSALERITERVSRNGDVNEPTTTRPLLTLEEFFEGNEFAGSIWCNLSSAPEPEQVFEILKGIRSRSNVADVRIEVTMFDDPDWPFSDCIWVITSATPEEVQTWFDDDFAPDDVWSGWNSDRTFEHVEVPTGMQPVGCFYD